MEDDTIELHPKPQPTDTIVPSWMRIHLGIKDSVGVKACETRMKEILFTYDLMRDKNDNHWHIVQQLEAISPEDTALIRLIMRDHGQVIANIGPMNITAARSVQGIYKNHCNGSPPSINNIYTFTKDLCRMGVIDTHIMDSCNSRFSRASRLTEALIPHIKNKAKMQDIPAEKLATALTVAPSGSNKTFNDLRKYYYPKHNEYLGMMPQPEEVLELISMAGYHDGRNWQDILMDACKEDDHTIMPNLYMIPPQLAASTLRQLAGDGAPVRSLFKSIKCIIKGKKREQLLERNPHIADSSTIALTIHHLASTRLGNIDKYRTMIVDNIPRFPTEQNFIGTITILRTIALALETYNMGLYVHTSPLRI